MKRLTREQRAKKRWYKEHPMFIVDPLEVNTTTLDMMKTRKIVWGKSGYVKLRKTTVTLSPEGFYRVKLILF